MKQGSLNGKKKYLKSYVLSFTKEYHTILSSDCKNTTGIALRNCELAFVVVLVFKINKCFLLIFRMTYSIQYFFETL